MRELGIEDFNIKIYDRWGLLVFEGNDPENGWNGTYKGNKAPVDAYYYLITAKGDGGKNIVLKGTVSLVR